MLYSSGMLAKRYIEAKAAGKSTRRLCYCFASTERLASMLLLHHTNQFQKMRIAFLVSNHCPTVVTFQRSHSPVFCKSKHGHAPEEEDEASESLPAAGWAMSRGMFFRCSRMLSVSPPSPMEVKKLMLKRMLRGVSCKHVCMCLSRCVQCS